MNDLFEMPGLYTPTWEELERSKGPNGKWTYADLRRWGVRTPLEKGWYAELTARVTFYHGRGKP